MVCGNHQRDRHRSLAPLNQKKYTPAARESMRPLVPHLGGCLATDRISAEGRLVGYMYREKPIRSEDTGWRVFAGDDCEP